MKKVIDALKWFFMNPTCVFCLGLVVTIVATLLEMNRSHAYNFYDYHDATMMFWGGMNPYTIEFAETHSIYFLYPPVFCVVFFPIFMLPIWLGPYVWNILHYSLFFLSIWTLPKPFAPHRMKIILFLLSVLLQNVFFFQYNLVVCYIFLFAFTLLEKNKPFWAVLLIMFSATTKIYGIVELGLLFCYPKVWRNFGYAALCGIGFFLLPAINPEFQLFDLYRDVRDNLLNHHSAVDYPGLLFARGLKSFLLPNYRIVQIATLVVLAILFFWRHKRWQDFTFRVQALAIIMGYIIILSDSPETHTYIIALTGYLMAFWLRPKHTWFDWTIFWLLFVNFNILPTDLLCPPKVHDYIHETFWLDVYTMTIAWLQVIWWAFGKRSQERGVRSQERGVKGVLLFLILLLPLGMQAQDKRYTVRGVSFVMRQVQGGEFTMGTNDPQAEADERPAHQVKVNDFYIGETEVTQELWEAIMGKNPSKNNGKQRPVEHVSYDDCLVFIQQLNQLTGKRFRLPTEAEWEYAAQKVSQAKGYLDGVREWCDSPYEEYTNPKNGFFIQLFRKQFRIIRGGSFQSSPRNTRITNRYPLVTWRRLQTVGFRLAM